MTATGSLSPTDTEQDVAPGNGLRERTPWLLGFLCLLIPILPAFVVLPGPLKSNGSPARMVAVALFALTILGFVLVRRMPARHTINPGAVLLVLYFLLNLVIYAVGLLHVGNTLVESNKTRAIINLTANVGVALYALDRVKTIRQRTFILGCLATGLAFACLVAILQSTLAIDLRLLFRPPGFVLNLDEQILELSRRQGTIRAVGTSQHPIEFSVLAAIAVPLTIHLARYATHRVTHVLSVIACGMALIAMPAAVSRTGLLAMGAALLVYMFACTVRQICTAVVVGCAGFVGYVMLLPDTVDALWRTITGSEEDPSILSRTEDYAAASETFRAHPLFGIGLGASPPGAFRFLDNEWLQAVVQGGVVGAAAMILLVGSVSFGIAAGLRRVRSRRERDQVYAIGSMLAAILVSSFTFDLFSFQQVTLIFFILLGQLWSTFSVPVSDRSALTLPNAQ